MKLKLGEEWSNNKTTLPQAHLMYSLRASPSLALLVASALTSPHGLSSPSSLKNIFQVSSLEASGSSSSSSSLSFGFRLPSSLQYRSQ